MPQGFPKFLPRVRVVIPTLLTMLLVVRFNTIIHPFTLADNRHYVFYVFRNLRRHYLVKYLAVPIYFICGWLVILALSGPIADGNTSKVKSSRSAKLRQGEQGLSEHGTHQESGNRVSFALVWLLSTGLSLITAPLVEPRYFIIPWIIWRTHVHPVPTDSETVSRLQERWQNYDYQLWLETGWYLTVNAVTGYVFLHEGFPWPQEPGNTQRFLW
jgi:alpha-1,2-glucosyltransferase